MVLDSLRNLLRKPRPAARRERSRPRTCRPLLESLEDRTAPAVLRVSPAGVDVAGCGTVNPCRSIQFAVNQAAPVGDIIQVASGTYTFSVDGCQVGAVNIGTGVVCVLNKQVQLFGGFSLDFAARNPSAAPSVIDGANTFRGVMVLGTPGATPASLQMDGFTIQNGLAVGIPQRQGFDQVTGIGGGMWVDVISQTGNPGPFVFRNLVFRNNRAVGSPTSTTDGGSGLGGGMALRGAGQNVLVEDVLFEGNQAVGNSGAVRGGVGVGGGFHASQSNAVLRRVTFTNNRAVAGSSTGSGVDNTGTMADGAGGALGLQAVQIGDTSAVLSFVTATGNVAQGGNAGQTGGGGYGGAFYSEQAALNITDTTIRGNVAQGGNAATGGGAGGGAVMDLNTNLILERNLIVDNLSKGGNTTGGGQAGAAGGGALYLTRFDPRTSVNYISRIVNNVIADNRTDLGDVGVRNRGGGGGAIWLQVANADLLHNTIARNRLGNDLPFGEAMILVDDGTPTATVANLAFNIIEGHTGANKTALQAHTSQTGRTNTLNLQRNLFVNNSVNTNQGQPGAGAINGFNSSVFADSAGFVSPGAPNFNYHLTQGSAAIDQAVGSTLTIDLDNQARSGTPDLGADEFTVQAEPPPPPTLTASTDNSRFLGGAYHDLLGRAVDQGGLAFFQPALDNARNAAFGGVALEYVTSGEFRGRVIRQLYNQYLSRNASEPEVSFWLSVRSQGATSEQILAFIVASPEYFQQGGSTNATWLDKLYRDALGRARDAGSQFFLDLLNSNQLSRIQVAVLILNSQEYRDRVIAAAYQQFLDRPAGQGDFAFWRVMLGQMPGGPGTPSPTEQFFTALLGAPEFVARAGNTASGWATRLYQRLLGREPDAGGLSYATNRVVGSYAEQRRNVLFSLAMSNEYRARRITAFYQEHLGRAPSAPEITFWTNVIQAGGTEEQVFAGIAGGDEAFARHGGDNARWLNQAYRDILERERGSGENFFLDLLNSGQLNRTQVATLLLNSPEYRRVLVGEFFQTHLRRTPSQGEADFWVAVLGANRNEFVLAFILSSPEYFLRTHQFP